MYLAMEQADVERLEQDNELSKAMFGEPLQLQKRTISCVCPIAMSIPYLVEVGRASSKEK